MMLIMGVLVFYPIFTTFSYSLKKWKLTSPGDIHYVGLKNYITVLTSESFKYSMQNTIFILVLASGDNRHSESGENRQFQSE